MVHGPCGIVNPQAPCMIDGKCSKGYPKLFSEDTQTDEDGFPSYRRRDNGRYIIRQGVACDNRWIVPYNRYLLVKFNAHINVEICSTIKSVKYLFKYIHKGHDRALAQLQPLEEHGDTLPQTHVDEVQEFLDSRYVSSSEASFRIFGGNMHGHSPAVIRLEIHLPNQHLVVFQDNTDLREHLQRAPTSTLEGWFLLNTTDPDARMHLYVDIPEYYTWRSNKWNPRKNKLRLSTIGRMYFVPPTELEKFCLRIFLHTVKGACSFQELRTFESIIHPSFKDACLARGLLENDEEWDLCLQEAITMTTSANLLRQLFVT